MSNASKTGQQEEGHADPSESERDLLGKLVNEDMIEVSERTNRVKEGTYIGCEYSLENIKGDGGVLSDFGTSKISKLTR